MPELIITPEDLTPEIRGTLYELEVLERELERRKRLLDMTEFGLPNLFFEPKKGEDELEYRNRQAYALKTFVEKEMPVVKDGQRRPIVLFRPMLVFLSDLLFGWTNEAVLWKPRGGGGSLDVALLMWLSAIYRQMSFTDVAGSQEQANNVYNYTLQWWDVFPELASDFLAGEPTLEETSLVTGVKLKVAPSSQRGVRGPHTPGLIIDEGCQEREKIDDIYYAALQGPLSEPRHCVAIVSTMHHPVGFFVDIWKTASNRGFKRYKWPIAATQEKCEKPIHCNECPLTSFDPVIDRKTGKVVGRVPVGCHGQARESDGFHTFDEAMHILRVNGGFKSRIYRVEYLTEEPYVDHSVYLKQDIDNTKIALADIPEIPKNIEMAVGIDWGKSEAAVVLLLRLKDFLLVRRAWTLMGEPVEQIIQILYDIEKQYGPNFRVLPDAEDAYSCDMLMRRGFNVAPVAFARYKQSGISNLQRYFACGKLRIVDDLEYLLAQLYQLRLVQSTGRVRKFNDHQCDALLAAALNFPFIECYAEDYKREEGLDGMPDPVDAITEIEDAEAELRAEKVERALAGLSGSRAGSLMF